MKTSDNSTGFSSRYFSRSGTVIGTALRTFPLKGTFTGTAPRELSQTETAQFPRPGRHTSLNRDRTPGFPRIVYNKVFGAVFCALRVPVQKKLRGFRFL